MFQYISCCYLSDFLKNFGAVRTTFQYISCCYLSGSKSLTYYITDCFNTSHVVIYHRESARGRKKPEFQYISCCYLSVAFFHLTGDSVVSIHLMLLFILIPLESLFCKYSFQYISCCYLSTSIILICQLLPRFNTSHVVIYQDLIPLSC